MLREVVESEYETVPEENRVKHNWLSLLDFL